MARTTADVAYEVLTAYLSSNVVESGEIPGLLIKVHKAILEVHGKGLPVYTPSSGGEEQAKQADEPKLKGNRPLRTDTDVLPTGVVDKVKDTVGVMHDYKGTMRPHIICLEDGKPMLMLARYVRTQYGLTKDAYLRRWGLPLDYPFTAPDWHENHSTKAKNGGLGTKGPGKGKNKAAV